MHILHMNQLREQARHAADTEAGPQSCPYPEGSEHAKVWLELYYQRVLELSMAVAA